MESSSATLNAKTSQRRLSTGVVDDDSWVKQSPAYLQLQNEYAINIIIIVSIM